MSSELDNDSNYDLPQIGTIVALNGVLALDPIQKDTQSVSVTGTWVGTLVFEASNDSSTWFTVQGFNVSTNAIVTSTTTNGNFIIPSAGYSQTRVRASVFSSGTANLANEGSHGTQSVFAMQPNAASFLATVSQGGTWNLNNITGTITLPTGASTSALQTTGNTSLSNIDAGIPAALGATTTANSMPVNIASDQVVPISATALPLPTGAATSALQSAEAVLIGAVTETAPASDTASSGLNGRLQRIAQRLTNLIALIPSTISIAWFSRISDGTNTAVITANGDLGVIDGLSGGGLAVLLSVPTANTPVEVKAGASRLANRKLVTFQAADADFYWGYANTVTAGVAGSGTLLKKGATAKWSADPAAVTPLQVWVVCATATKTGKVTESA